MSLFWCLCSIDWWPWHRAAWVNAGWWEGAVRSLVVPCAPMVTNSKQKCYFSASLAINNDRNALRVFYLATFVPEAAVLQCAMGGKNNLSSSASHLWLRRIAIISHRNQIKALARALTVPLSGFRSSGLSSYLSPEMTSPLHPSPRPDFHPPLKAHGGSPSMIQYVYSRPTTHDDSYPRCEMLRKRPNSNYITVGGLVEESTVCGLVLVKHVCFQVCSVHSQHYLRLLWSSALRQEPFP